MSRQGRSEVYLAEGTLRVLAGLPPQQVKENLVKLYYRFTNLYPHAKPLLTATGEFAAPEKKHPRLFLDTFAANLVISVPGPNNERLYMVYYGHSIFAPQTRDGLDASDFVTEDPEERDLGNWSLESDPLLVRSVDDLDADFKPLTKSDVIEKYERVFKVRGSDVAIERVVNFVYIFRSDVTVGHKKTTR